MSVLETERRYLANHRDELLRLYGDKFLVIKGEEVTGAFDTITEAIADSVSRYGLSNALIRQAAEAELEISVPALTLGILNANPERTNRRPGDDSGR